MIIAVICFTCCTLIVTILHLAAIFGYPVGAYLLGGATPGVLAPTKRAIATLALLILWSAEAVVLMAGNALWFRATWSDTAIWFVIGLFSLSTILNAITRSPKERRLGLPMALGMLGSSLFIALAQ